MGGNVRRGLRQPGLEPEEPEYAGVRCSRCLTELQKGELYGECGGRVVCAECVDEEWAELTKREKLEMLGFDTEGSKEWL